MYGNNWAIFQCRTIFSPSLQLWCYLNIPEPNKNTDIFTKDMKVNYKSVIIFFRGFGQARSFI